MPIFAVYRREADTCGSEDIYGPIRYVEAENIKEVEEIYPHGFLCGHEVREIKVESIAWINIQNQLGVKP